MEKQKKELAQITCDNTSLMEQIVSMGGSDTIAFGIPLEPKSFAVLDWNNME